MVCYTERPARSANRSATRDTDTNKEQLPGASKSTDASTLSDVAQESFEQKTAPAKSVKKKQKETEPEPIDELPTKRVTRAQLKECNIVLEKISPDASVESLTTLAANTKKVGRKKRMRPEEAAAAKKADVKKVKTAKNIDPDMHSLKKIVDCPVCDKPAKLSVVNHFVTAHPDIEVFTSRLAPAVADTLRNAKNGEVVAERFQPEGRRYQTFSHICYFCNVSKSMTKLFWMNHIAKHTGYYQYRCNDCSRKFSEKSTTHMCKGENNLSKIPQPQFGNKKILMAYICDLCNFVRLNRPDIEKHLRCEHETTDIKQYKEVVLLAFPKRHRKGHEQEEEGGEEEEDASDSSSDEEVVSPKKRRKVKVDDEEKDVPEVSPAKKTIRSRVVNTEAFISEPKEDDGLFDKDTMKLMKDMSFSASKDGECTARSNRAKSIAEKLSERFNSVHEDNAIPSVVIESETKPAKTEPLDPLTCDEGIPIVRVTPTDNLPPPEEESSNVVSTTDVHMELKITNGK